MIFLYSSNHERMWHNLVLALTIEVFWLWRLAVEYTHSYQRWKGKVSESLDRKMLAVHDWWWHRVQWVSPEWVCLSAGCEPCVCCAVADTSPGRRRWMGRLRRQGCQSMTRMLGDTRFSNVAKPPRHLFECDSLFSGQDLKSFTVECVQILVCGRWLSDCVRRPHLLKQKTGVSFNSRRRCVSSLW